MISIRSSFGRDVRWGMSEQTENPALAELLDSIEDRRTRRKVHKLLHFGEEAVRSLGELDAALYLREDGEDQLQIVADAVMSHVRRLLEYLGMVAAEGEAGADAGPAELRVEFPDGDSLGGRNTDGAQPAGPPVRKSMRDMVARRQQTDDDKWRALTGEMDTLQFALGSEIKEFDRRFSEALHDDRKDQALTDLNDATTSLMDGVFAVMTSVYECFLGYAEPERMIPGHRDTLGKALAVRRALADLRREVREHNRAIQNRESSPLVLETSYRLVVQCLFSFVEGDSFLYLRSDTRKEFHNFCELLSQGDPARSRRECEGFDKYLDSLAFVSQRGVLIKHDTDLRAKIVEELDRALRYAALLPEIVCDVIEQAFVKGERLFGLNDQIDAVVIKWSSLSQDQRNDFEEVIAMARLLRDVAQPAAAPAPPADGDFF